MNTLPVSTETRTYHVKRDLEVQTCEVAPDLLAYKVTRTTSHDGKPPHVTTFSGLAWRKELDAAFTDDCDFKWPPTPRTDHGECKFSDDKSHKIEGFVRMVKPEFLEAFRQHGFSGNEGRGVYDQTLYLDSDPIATVLSGIPFLLVDLLDYSHEAFRLDGTPLANVLYFGYIDGRMDNGEYDLRKAVECLLKHPDVELIPGAGERKDLFQKHKKGSVESFIADIPYYNASRNRSQCIAFRWHSTQEDWERVHACAKSLKENGSWALRQAVLEELDIFGLKACKLAKKPGTDEDGSPDNEDED